MESSIFKMIAELLHEKKNKRRWLTVLICLALVVAIGTVASLTMRGHAMNREVKVLDCQLTLHQHTADCFDQDGSQICGQADYVVHVHNDDCYDDTGTLVCQIPEREAHTHTEDCLVTEEVLVCGFEEDTGHQHTDACYTEEPGELACGLEEHIHDEACYDEEGELVCGYEEHTHSDDCYAVESVLTCGQTEGDGGHTHTDDCYEVEEYLDCGELELHTHDDDCYEIVLDERGNILEKNLTCEEIELEEHVHHGEDCFDTEIVQVQNSLFAFFTTGEDAAPETGGNEIATIAYPNGNGGTAYVMPDDINGATLSVAVKKKVEKNGVYVWQTADTFEPGDRAQITLSFNIPEGGMKQGDTLIYELPQGFIDIEPGKQFSILENGKKVGTATVNADGTLSVEFDDSFDVTKGFAGKITLEGEVQEYNDGKGGKVRFPGTGDYEVKIEAGKKEDTTPSGPSISLEKKDNGVIIHKDANGNITGATIDYEVRIEVKNAAAGKITLEDYFKTANIPGSVIGDVKVYKSDGSQVSSVSTNTTSKGVNVTFDGPGASNSEVYTVKYTVTLDAAQVAALNDGTGYSRLVNHAEAKDEKGNSSQMDDTVTVQERQIEKTGFIEYDNNGQAQYLVWRINVSANNAGATLKDYIPDTWLNSHSDMTKDEWWAYLYNNATVTTKKTTNGQSTTVSGPTMDQLKNGWQVPSNDSYLIEIRIPWNNVKDKLSAGEWIANGAELGGNKSEGGASAPWGNNENNSDDGDSWGSEKKVDSWDFETDNDGMPTVHKVTWRSTIKFPDEDWDDATYADYFEQQIIPGGVGQPYAVPHYAEFGTLKAELEASVNEALKAYPGVTATFSYYSDEGGVNDITNTAIDTDQVKSFKITLHLKDGADYSSLVGEGFSFTYTTEVHLDEITVMGSDEGYTLSGNYKIYNDYEMESGLHRVGVQFTHKRQPSELRKSAATSKSGTFTSGDLTMSINADGDTFIWYEIEYQLGDGQAPYVITDYLPDGLIFDEDCTAEYIGYFRDSNNTDQGTQEGGATTFKPDYDSNSNVLTFTISSTPNYNNWPCVAIKVRFSAKIDKSVLNEGNLLQDDDGKLYWNLINRASADGKSTRQTTEVEYPGVSKGGVQMKDDDGEVTNKARYWIEVNPDGLDLIPGQDTVTLSDVITIKNGKDYDAGIYLDMSSVKVYQKDANGKIVGELDSDQYSFSLKKVDNPNSRDLQYELTVELPDSMAIRLEYEYVIDYGAATMKGQEFTLTNNAHLEGGYDGEKSVQWATDYEYGEVWQKNVKLYKVEQGKYNVQLPDAEFKIYMWDATNEEWVPYYDTYTFVTDEDGILYFNCHANTANLPSRGSTVPVDYDTLYAIVEVSAPAGYQLTDDVYFLNPIFSEEASTWWSNIQSKLAGKEIGNTHKTLSDFDTINFGKDENDAIYAENPSNGITVKKQWLYDMGDGTTAPDTREHNEIVEVTLYQRVKDSTGDGIIYQVTAPEENPAPLSAANNWTYNWTNLPATDPDNSSIEYEYYVVETLPDGTQYTVEYSIGKNTSQDGSVIVSTGDDKITVSNISQPDHFNLTADKSWDDPNQDESKIPEKKIILQLMYKDPDGVTHKWGDPVELTEADGWSYTWKGLPKIDGYEFYVEEISGPEGYSATYAADGEDDWKTNASDVSVKAEDVAVDATIKVQVKNTYSPDTQVTVEKKWADNDNVAGRPEKVTVTLKRKVKVNGQYVEDDSFKAPDYDVTYDLTPELGWTHTWGNLDKYDDDGNLYLYYVEEVSSADGYTTYYTDENGEKPKDVGEYAVNTGADSTLYVLNKKAGLDVEKQWVANDGTTPVSAPVNDIQVNIYAKFKENESSNQGSGSSSKPAAGTEIRAKDQGDGTYVVEGYESNELLEFTLKTATSNPYSSTISVYDFYYTSIWNGQSNFQDNLGEYTLMIPKGSQVVIAYYYWDKTPQWSQTASRTTTYNNYDAMVFDVGYGNSYSITLTDTNTGSVCTQIKGIQILAPDPDDLAAGLIPDRGEVETTEDGWNIKKVSTITLSELNNWTDHVDITDFADLENCIFYVQEVNIPDNFTVSYQVVDENGNLIDLGAGVPIGNSGLISIKVVNQSDEEPPQYELPKTGNAVPTILLLGIAVFSVCWLSAIKRWTSRKGRVR